MTKGYSRLSLSAFRKKIMAVQKKIPHQVTIDGLKYMAMLPDIYENIKDVVGIAKAPNPDNTNYAGKLNISDAIAGGDLVRIICSLDTPKRTDKTVLCTTQKFASAMGGLLSKKVGGIDVRTTRIRRRMRLG